MAIHTLSLFSGGGGLDLGIHLALPAARTVCYVEREAFAASALVARMEEGSLASAPIWSDVATFQGRNWRGVVDLVIGGFPCQDVSNAGKRAGLDGDRSGLWREYARIIGEIRPALVFVENVSALRSRGLDRVLKDLAALGYDAEWDCFRASDVGAPHRRERIFIIAQPSPSMGNAARFDAGSLQIGYDSRACRPSEANVRLGDTDSPGLERWSEPECTSADKRATWPPGPTNFAGWADYLQLRPDAEPSVCGGDHGVASGLEHRTDRLRLLGNGVVPQMAAVAFRVLFERLSR